MKWITTRTYQFLVKFRIGIRLLDILRGIAEFLKCLPANLAFRYHNPHYPVPPLAVLFDANAHMNYQKYKTSGEEAANFYSRLFQNHHNFSEKTETRILEWGCGPARIIRHFLELNPHKNIRLYGSDYNSRTIKWCHQNIPEVEFCDNDLTPPLPFPDDSLDIVFCLSVFTHLSLEKTTQWLTELHRVTTPGGLVSFSTQGDSYLQRLGDEERQQYLAGNPVIRNSEIEGKKYFSAFHPPKYITEELGKGFHLVETVTFEAPKIGQDVWLLRKV